jgi:hypothetical protein
VSARVIEVIEVETTRGNGSTTPIRGVMQYYSKEGVLLAERCPSLMPAVRKIASDTGVDVDDFNTLKLLLKETP